MNVRLGYTRLTSLTSYLIIRIFRYITFYELDEVAKKDVTSLLRFLRWKLIRFRSYRNAEEQLVSLYAVKLMDLKTLLRATIAEVIYRNVNKVQNSIS